MKYLSKTPAETRRIGAKFAKGLKAGTWIGLYGDLGAGKTTFVQGMALGLGINPRNYVSSPTFTMVNVYDGKEGRLVHVDLYRVKDTEEIETLGLNDYDEAVMVVEWAEKLKKAPEVQVRLKTGSEKEVSEDLALPGRAKGVWGDGALGRRRRMGQRSPQYWRHIEII